MILRRFHLIRPHICNINRKFCSTPPQDVTKYPERIFSGIQPTGQMHLGNYLGAISQWIRLQNEGKDMILSIVDLHSITLPQNPKILRDNILEMTATLLACGIDPRKVILFQQSAVPAHTQLCWCLGCISTMARLGHLPAYKEKSANLQDIPLGLFVYPVLQAADILAYKTTHVPVGEDQAQHIQLSQDLARMFNKRFGETFPMPHGIFTDSQYSRLKSLRDPTKKMSKSDPDPKSRICLMDSPDEIVKKLKKAVTDFTSEVTFDADNRPGVSNLLSIHSFVSGLSIEQICNDVQNINTGQYKNVVAEAVVSHLSPIQKKLTDFLSNMDYLEAILNEGAAKACEISEKTVAEVQEKLGLRAARRKQQQYKLKM